MSKTIYFLRHAKAEGNEGDKSDFKRELIKEGIANIRDIATAARQSNVSVDQVMASASARTIETAKRFVNHLEWDPAMVTEHHELYGADEEEVLTIIQSINPVHESLLMVGHNPELTDVANRLSGRSDLYLSTAALVKIEFNTSTWTSINWNSGTACFLFIPADRIKRLPILKRLEYQLRENLLDELLKSAGLSMNVTSDHLNDYLREETQTYIARIFQRAIARNGVIEFHFNNS